MLYTIAEVSNLIGLSKVSIYKKLKLKELQEHIVKKQGITYIDDMALSLLRNGLNLKEEVKSDLNEEVKTEDESVENPDFKGGFNIKDDYINYLKSEIERLRGEMQEKNKQIDAEKELHKNTQLLLNKLMDKIQDTKMIKGEPEDKVVDADIHEQAADLQPEGSPIKKKWWKFGK